MTKLTPGMNRQENYITITQQLDELLAVHITQYTYIHISMHTYTRRHTQKYQCVNTTSTISNSIHTYTHTI